MFLVTELGGAPMSMSPAEFRKLIQEETEKWGKVVKFLRCQAGLTAKRGCTDMKVRASMLLVLSESVGKGQTQNIQKGPHVCLRRVRTFLPMIVRLFT